MARPSWVDDDIFPFRSRFVEIDGHRIHYVDEGRGPAILMHHGNPTWSFLYRHVIAGLSAEHRCIAWDLPGFGLSRPADDYGFTAAAHADVAERFVEALDLDDITVTVQDWGGPIGLAAAARHPRRYTGLIIGNTWGWPTDKPLAKVFSAVLGGRFGRYLIERRNFFVETFVPSGHQRTSLSEAEMDHYRGPFPDPASRRPAWVFPREITRAVRLLGEVETGLSAFRRTPALLVWGDRDPAFGRRELARWTQALPNATVHVLEGAGHYVPDDAPDEVVDVVSRWMTDVRRGR